MRRGRALRHRIVVAVLVALAVAVAAVTAPVVVLTARVERIPGVFHGGHAWADDGSLDVVLIGVDRRGGSGPEWLPGHPDVTTLAVVHLDADHRGAAVRALPLGAAVNVPGTTSGPRSMPLGAAVSRASPEVLVHALEELTGRRMQHLAVLDWEVIHELIDRVGGVELELDAADHPRFPPNDRGYYYVDAARARSVVARVGDDEAVVRRQLVVLEAAVGNTLSQELHRRPVDVYRLLDVVTSGLAVDEGWSTLEMAALFRVLWTLRSADIRYEVLR